MECRTFATVFDALAAVRLARASHDRFTLALIDRTHPETDGERDAREELGRELKILTFSACDDDSAVRAGDLFPHAARAALGSLR